jgi:hypothetical protein
MAVAFCGGKIGRVKGKEKVDFLKNRHFFARIATSPAKSVSLAAQLQTHPYSFTFQSKTQ